MTTGTSALARRSTTDSNVGRCDDLPKPGGEVVAKATTVTVTGDFDAIALVKQFNDAGFHVKVDAE